MKTESTKSRRYNCCHHTTTCIGDISTLMAHRYIKTVLRVYVFIFISFFSYWSIVGYKENIPGYMIALQFGYFVIYTISLYYTSRYKISLKQLIIYIFLYSLFASFIVRYVSWVFLREPFLGGVDSVTYDTWARSAVVSQMPFYQYIKDMAIDDYGMSVIVWATYKLFGFGQVGQDILILFNSVVIALSALRLDGILRYLSIHKSVRIFCVAAYACFPFLSLTSAIGLKENFFVFVIISAYYYILCYKERSKIRYLIYSLAFASCCLFFRIAICAMVVLSFAVSLISKESNKKTLLVIIVTGIIAGFFILNMILQLLYGIDMERLGGVTAYRMSDMDDALGGTMAWLVHGLALIFGPFANFSHLSEYAIIHSSGVLLKGVLGYPMLCGIWQCIRQLQWRSYALLIYFLLHITMLIIVCRGLDMRYQITLFPMTIPFIAQGLQGNKHPKWFALYGCVLVGILWFYNQRDL